MFIVLPFGEIPVFSLSLSLFYCFSWCLAFDNLIMVWLILCSVCIGGILLGVH